uniref:Reverse transcriptase domain-containing protein n=1 Tax=Oryzias latipes TaxID=8090 RepID=A0A3P9J295_ORYLA
MNLIVDRSKLPDHSVLYLRSKTIETNFINNMQIGSQNKKPIRKLPVNFLEFCFMNGFIPSSWYKSIIKPIPKSPQADTRVPLNYRGISLLCTVYKVFSSILNNQLSQYLETNQVLVEQQNGFRRN